MQRGGRIVIVVGAVALGMFMLLCCGGLLLMNPANTPQTAAAPTAVSVTPKPAKDPVVAPVTPPNAKPVGEVDNVTASDIFGSAAPAEAATPLAPKERAKSSIPPTGLDVDDRSVKVPPFREWNARAGGFKVAAKFVKLADGQVELLKQSGGVAKVPLEKLSRIDVDYVQDLIRVHPKANVIIGKVLAAASSNSVLISEEGTQKIIELYGIATPEPGQEYYREAKEDLSNRVRDKYVWVEWIEMSKDSKPIGIIYVDGRNANLDLVADGMAWHDIRVSADQRLANAEFMAREKRLGFWKLPNPTPPWDQR